MPHRSRGWNRDLCRSSWPSLEIGFLDISSESTEAAGSGGEAFLNVLQRPVGAGVGEFVDGVGAGRNADDADSRSVAGADVPRSVADRDRLRLVEWVTGDLFAPLQGLLRQLRTVAGIGAVAAEGEETVEVAAGKLDVGGRLDVAGDHTEQDALLDQARQQLLDPLDHEVALRFG